MLLLSVVRACLRSAGWKWGRLRKLNIYLRSATKTSRDRSRCPCDSHNHIMPIKACLLDILWMCDHLSSQVWSESSDGSGAVNFLTGMGGFLQAVLFGYPGFRLVNVNKLLHMYTACRLWYEDWHAVFLSRVQKECLAFSPLLPNDISELSVRGVSYLGHQMDWLLTKDDVCIILREQADSLGNTKSCNLQVVLKASGTKIPLTPGDFCF